MNKKFFFIFRLIVAISIFFALFKFVPYKKIVEVYKDSEKIYLFFGACTFLSCYLIAVVRWRFLLSSLGIHITLREAFYAFFSGLFFNLFFPSFVAGDVFRGVSISYRYGDAKKVASSVLMDRFNGATALTLVALVSFLIGNSILRNTQVMVTLSILCFVVGSSFLVIFSKKVFSLLIKVFKRNKLLQEKLISFHDQLYFFKKNPQVFMKSLCFSSLIQILVPLSFFITSRAFGLKLSIIYFLILVPLIMAIAFIPITIAGAGTREASAVYFFSLVGVEKSIGLGISLFNFLLSICLGIIGGIFYVGIYHRWLQSRL